MLVKPITHPILRQRFRGFSAKATRERQRLPGPRARGRPPCGRARRTRPRTARAPGTRRARASRGSSGRRSEEHTSELQSHSDLVCRLLLEKKKRRKEHRYILKNNCQL